MSGGTRPRLLVNVSDQFGFRCIYIPCCRSNVLWVCGWVQFEGGGGEGGDLRSNFLRKPRHHANSRGIVTIISNVEDC